jgi:hypothetical protein
VIAHVVLFKLKESSPEAEKTALLRELVGLRTAVPGILEASAGANFSARARGYTHGFVVRFGDRRALETYLTHPAHVRVVEERVKPLSEGVLALDYEFS